MIFPKIKNSQKRIKTKLKFKKSHRPSLENVYDTGTEFSLTSIQAELLLILSHWEIITWAINYLQHFIEDSSESYPA